MGKRGAAGWRWDDVLPYFRKLERDIDFEGPLHGSDGRIPVRRVFPDNWSDYAKAAAEAFALAGYKYVPDQNGVFEDGYYPLTMSNLYDRRVSAAVGYLGPAVRHRDNLTILTETQVCELLFDDTEMIGLKAKVGQQLVNSTPMKSSCAAEPSIPRRCCCGPGLVPSAICATSASRFAPLRRVSDRG